MVQEFFFAFWSRYLLAVKLLASMAATVGAKSYDYSGRIRKATASTL